MRTRKYKINEDFFKKWSRDMAYIFGFWFADGHIHNRCNGGYQKGKPQNRYVWGLSQDISDSYLLKSFLLKMGCNYPLYYEKKKHHCRILICSKEIVKDILGLGGEYRKSLICSFPTVPKKYLPDFIRGLWDGDGTIHWSKHCHGSKSLVSGYVSGSEKFVYKMLSVLKNNIAGLGGKIYKTRPNIRLKSVYYIRFCYNDTVRLGQFMYRNLGNNLKLNRKHNLFLLCNKIKHSTHDRKFLIFKDARKIIRSFNFKGINEWKRYSRSGKMPDYIPKDPYKTYKNKGWKNYYDWVGKTKPEYLSFDEAKRFMHRENKNLGLRTWEDWKEYSSSRSRPIYIPSAPNRAYKNQGWLTLADWLRA